MERFCQVLIGGYNNCKERSGPPDPPPPSGHAYDITR